MKSPEGRAQKRRTKEMKVLREVRRVNVPMLEAQTRVVCKCQFWKVRKGGTIEGEI